MANELIVQGTGKIYSVYYGGSAISSIYRGSELIWNAPLKLPTTNSVYSKYTLTEVARADGASYKVYTVPSDGFYQVEVNSGGGGAAYKGTAGVSAKTTQIVWLYAGTQCLLWGATAGQNGGQTGYPVPTEDLGGHGGEYLNGRAESGGYGGGAASNGAVLYSRGGGGSGFVAGINKRVQSKTFSNSAWRRTLESTQPWTAGSVFHVDHAYSFVLCGGGGGACSDEHGTRASGAGGGAWGDGGNIRNDEASVRHADGPGGTWGRGGYGNFWEGSPGGAGAWAILDFSRNQLNYGLGGGSGGSQGYCVLRRLTRTSRYLVINNSQGATITMTYNGTTSQRSSLEIDGGTVVSWQVSKYGYVGQSGTVTLNNDTTLNITLKAIPTPENLDMGLNTESVAQTIDCGNITGTISETINCGGLNG